MGDAHTDQERESTREYNYIMYLRQLKKYLAKPMRRNYYENF